MTIVARPTGLFQSRQPGRLGPVTCELVWVLARRARQSRETIADAVERLLDTEMIVVADSGIARRALVAYREGAGDFAVYWMREQSLVAGATEVVTFDRAVRGEPGFKVLG